MPNDSRQHQDFDAVIVGAGFAGLYMLYRLRELGLSVRVFEAGSGVGGTWFWNRYPGARCDAVSVEYSYQFSEELQQEWDWSERYASQPEILRYLNHVADRFALRPDIQLNTRVRAAHFDEAAQRWSIETADARISAKYCIMATGCLSSTNIPAFNGLDSFAGAYYHTGNWPHEGVDFTAKRVGVIGTGSSAIQAIPVIAKESEHLFVFQRTANYSIPAHNGSQDPELVKQIKADYVGFRRRIRQMPFGNDLRHNEADAVSATAEQRELEYEDRWQQGGLPFLGAYADLLFSRTANDSAADFIRGKIRQIVDDPEVARRLSPQSIVGCKRLCVDTGYYETFNRSNVTLVDVSQSPIEEITREGLTVAGQPYRLDSIVFATGYDAMTGTLLRIDIRGGSGRTLREKWADGPRTYLGVTTAGFPNLFTVTGPGSPSVLSQMVPSIEHHVDWIAGCLEYLQGQDVGCIEASVEAEDAWVTHVNEVADQTLFTSCNSWYVGANIPGKPRVFMPYIGVPPYVEKCDEVAANGYEGFVLG